MQWDAAKDEFFFKFNFHKVDPEVVAGKRAPTKREVLRLNMSLFDPLGLLAHYIIKVKVLLQQLWRQELKWDDDLPGADLKNWQDWLDSPSCLQYFIRFCTIYI